MDSLGRGPRSGYQAKFFPLLFAVEDRHFWFRARQRTIAAIVAELAATLPSGYRVLEIGCGTGQILSVLERTCRPGSVSGMDRHAEGLRYARLRTSCALVQGDILAPPFRGRFDLIGLFDVLEHVGDDVGVLSQLYSMLTDRGVLLLTVPAHQSLWSYFDEASHHCRRYESDELEEKLAGSGYRVEYLTQFMSVLYPLMWLGRRIAARFNRHACGRSDGAEDLALAELKVVPVVNSLLTWLLALEAGWLARRRHLPVGSSLLALARRG